MEFLGSVSFYVYVIFLAFIISVIVPGKEYYLKWFPLFLGATFVAEMIGNFIWYKGGSNVLLYNCFTTIEFCFYLYVLGQIIQKARTRKIIRVCLIVFAILATLNIIAVQTYDFHSYTYVLGCVMVVTFSISYFLGLFQQKKSVALLREPAFWICSGLLFYYSCSFPLIATLNFLSGLSNASLILIYQLIELLNVFLYIIFSIAFLCRIKIRKYTTSS